VTPARRRLPIILLFAGGAVALFGFVIVLAGALWWFLPRQQDNPNTTDKGALTKGKTEVVPGTITPEEATRSLHKICTVEMLVRGTGLSKNQKMLFLNSQANYKAPTNFTIVVQNLAMDPGMELEKLAASYDKKTVRVTGQVSQFNEQKQIIVDDLAKIEIVPPK
jgi:hypothetical protein